MSYDKWGLGIEHEMRVRFTNSLNDLSDNIKQTYFDKDNNKDSYIFIKSEVLLYYFYLYEIVIMRKFKDYLKTPDDYKYYENLLIKLDIFDMAKKGIKFPLDNKKYFNLYELNDDIKKKNIELFNLYVYFYTLFHAPLLFFSYYLDKEGLEISLNLFFNYNKLLEEEKNKEVIKETLRENLEKIYNHDFTKKTLKYLKKLFEKEKTIEKVDLYIELYKGFEYLNRPKLLLKTLFKNTENNNNNNNNNNDIINKIDKINHSKNKNTRTNNSKSKISKNKISKISKNKKSKSKKLFGGNEGKYINFNQFIEIINNKIKNFASIFNIDNNRKNIYNKLNLIDNYNFYKNLSILYSNRIPEIDNSYQTSVIEFKTVEFSNMNFEKGLSKLIELEETFFIVVNSIPEINKYIDVFGNLIYHNIGSVDTSLNVYDLEELNYEIIEEDYAGSYHIWITCPHQKYMPIKKFLNIHSTLANKFQLLEPILAAHYSSPSYNVFKESNIESKSSLRQFINWSSNYGTSDVSLINGGEYHKLNRYYLSESDLLEDKIFIIKDPKFTTKIYDNKGNLILNYKKLADRIITNNIFKLIQPGNNESSNINVNNYLNMLFEKTNIRPKTKVEWDSFIDYFYELGADIRTLDMSHMIYPLHEDWKKCHLYKNGKIIELYYNHKLKKISYERIYNNDEYLKSLENKRVGIEMRIFDHFPTKYLNQIMSILVPMVLDSCKNPKEIKSNNTHVSKQYWHNEMFKVITNGYSYTLDTPYIKAIEREFEIKIGKFKNMNSSVALKLIHDAMHEKYSLLQNKEQELYIKMKFHHPINFFSFNKIAWFEIIHKFFSTNPMILRKLLYFNKDLRNSDIINVLGNQYSYDLKKLKNYLVEIQNKPVRTYGKKI